MITNYAGIEQAEKDAKEIDKKYQKMLSYGLDKETPPKPTINYAALFIWAAIITFFIMFVLLTAFNLFFPY